MAPQYIHIDFNGSKFYYKDKEMKVRHREDGPAIEWCDGTKSWWINGKLHREDGPAIEWCDGNKTWWINGVKLSEEEHARRTSKVVELTMDQIAALAGVDVSKLKIVKN